ncbi:MAG: hypothetical protein VKO39_07840 [Cyanobacteriota bacterium]|nr:hypothetical protein [Cyanobacteriota bacterium]
MPLFEPLSRYRAEPTAFQSVDLVAGAPGVISLSELGNVDDAAVAVDLGGNGFRFYGKTFSGNNLLLVSSNGLITFGAAETS